MNWEIAQNADWYWYSVLLSSGWENVLPMVLLYNILFRPSLCFCVAKSVHMAAGSYWADAERLIRIKRILRKDLMQQKYAQ